MDVFGIGFILVVCVLGGIIAVVADNLGRTLGKKRLSVKSRFIKLRPRRTAQVFTFGAGVIIPLLTLVSVMLLSADVRQWFAEGPDLIRQRDVLTEEVSSRKKELEALTVQNEQAKLEVAGERKKLASAQDELKKLGTKLSQFEAKVTSLTREAQALSRRTAQLTQKASQLSAQILTKTNMVNQLTAKVEAQQKAYGSLNVSFEELSRQIKESFEYNKQLQDENSALGKTNDDLKKQISQLSASIDGLSKEYDSKRLELENSLANKQRELELTAMELDKKRGELQRADLQLQQVGAIAIASRHYPMMYRKGEEVARIQIPSNLDRNKAMDQLMRLLRIAKTEAESRGAKGRGTFPSAGIMDRLDPNEDQIISSDQQMQSIVARLTGLSEGLVLVAASSVNAFLGEPVSLDIQSFRNPVVFAAGEMVAEARIDGEKPEESVVDEISEFVRNDVRKKAVQGGMVPTLGSENGYGELSQNTLLALMRTARSNNRRVRIQAFALKDIRAGDPLTLEYRIR